MRKVLDVGCAAGGFSRIMHAFNRELRYVGVDITPALISIASRNYPDSEFCVSDGIHLPFIPGFFDLVHSSGVLHLNSCYRDMVRAMWEQAGRYLLCDFRVIQGHSVTGEMQVDFGGCDSHGPVLPYHVLNLEELLAFFKSLVPVPTGIRAKGYSHEVSRTARVPLKKVIMAFFLLEKNREQNLPRFEISFED